MSEVDTIIRNGQVIDPANTGDQIVVQDVALKDGKIFATGTNLNLKANTEFDATGCLVTPGLIDAHVHCYQYATPLGINPDDVCLSRGTTTVIDAGSSGASTFHGLKKFIVERSKTRVRCLLHIALHGLAASGCAGAAPGGESDTVAILDEESCRKCIEANRDVIVGVKVRLSANVCADGATEEEAYRRSLAVSKATGLPLMVHHSRSTIPTQRGDTMSLGCPGDLKKGDIYTHTFHGKRSTILDTNCRDILPDVKEAQARGVYFDVGHGQAAFSWTVGEICAERKFWPDLLGTDLHSGNKDGPVYDLPTIMSKFLHLGMPVCAIIRAATSTPAHAYGLDDTIGSFDVGKEADVTVMRIEDCDVKMEDACGQVRRLRKRFEPVTVWRAGERCPISKSVEWPSLLSRERAIGDWNDQWIIKDGKAPTLMD